MTAQPTNSRIRVLVVEDHAPFRRHICSVLTLHSHFQLIGTSDDGPKAVQQAKALRPDVVLLDIGLPGVNGLEAARQIGEAAPLAKIIFLTQESSPEVVQEAFSVGAWGYVLKVNAGSELIVALETVSKGQQFVGRGLQAYTASSQKA